MEIEEKWLPIKGFEGRYEVSDGGRVRSLPKGPLGKIRLLGSLKKNGHIDVCLSNGKDKRYPLVATLVANAFVIKPASNKVLRVKHIDGDKSNCFALNLEWETVGDIVSRNNASSRGALNYQSILTDELVMQIREAYSTASTSDIVAQFQISKGAITPIICGKTWKHLPVLEYPVRKKKLYKPRPDFEQAARTIHGDKYDYSQVVYVRTLVPVKIICPVHGAFLQAPNTHMQGGGCRKCGRERQKEKTARSWVDQADGRIATLYFIRLYSDSESFYKVGVTFDTMYARWGRKRTRPGYQYEVLALSRSANPSAIWDWEQSILETFSHLRYRPKTRFEGETECFSSCEEILAIFPL